MRPNIVFIVADDLGYADLSCCGRRDFSTPNIDRIAERGLRFTQAYANSAVCSATRLALITGRYQYRLPLGLEETLPVTTALWKSGQTSWLPWRPSKGCRGGAQWEGSIAAGSRPRMAMWARGYRCCAAVWRRIAPAGRSC